MVQKNAEVTERKKKQPIFASSSTVYREAIAKLLPRTLLFIHHHFMVPQNLPVRLLYRGIANALLFKKKFSYLI